ncbi:MAG: hypothetical protein R3E73_07505 [Porticoccaceae bacterium]
MKNLFVVSLFVCFLSSCSDDLSDAQKSIESNSNKESVALVSGGELTDKELEEKILSHLKKLYQRFSPAKPGFGLTDYSKNDQEDIPKAYAKILMAELTRGSISSLSELNDIGVNAGYWLLNNSDLNADGVQGWGVPIAWDAYGDGSINAAHTEYTITTAIVLDALIEWYLAPVSAPKTQVMQQILDAVEPYLNSAVLSSSGLLPYSLRDVDRKYNTFNPAAYLAGQLQRLSLLVKDVELSERLSSVADMTMLALYQNHLINGETGSWYWYYSIEEHVPNDLPHASYIIDGINTYIENSGRYSDKFDIGQIRSHLHEFVDGSRVRVWPLFRKDVAMSARSYDLGMALYLTCSYPELKNLSKKYIAAVDGYLSESGKYLKYPISEGHVNNFSVNEYEAYLYRGLMTCAKHDDEVLTLPLGRASNISETLTVVADIENSDRVPFALESQDSQLAPLSVKFDSAEKTFDIYRDGEVLARTQNQGIPVAVFDVDGSLVVMARGLSSGEISLQKLGTGYGITKTIEKISDANLIFRAAKWYRGGLYAVLYDSPTAKNYLFKYVLNGDEFFVLDGQPTEIPSLRDPAGSTYEMIPSIYFSESESGISLVGGDLIAEINNDNNFLIERHIPGCSRVVEVLDTKDGPVSLCLKSEESSIQGTYFINGPDGYSWKTIPDQETPWSLGLEGKEVTYFSANNASEYAELLAFDLRRAQQCGWMEFGIDNQEGRVPWSQIYYLNGYLDILYIADRNPFFYKAFKQELSNIRVRLDMEMSLIDSLWERGGYHTKAFTVDRSPALFAVQTARLLLLMERYSAEVVGGVKLNSYHAVKQAVHDLDHHIEEMAFNGELEAWIEEGKPYLRWPTGSAFYFDGTAVPYNHQNEWAYSLLFAKSKDEQCKTPNCSHAKEIINYFLERQSFQGELPRSGIWDYWWGVAREGWSAENRISINKPEFSGDYLKAWISFRSIDVMASLQAKRFDNDATKVKLESSALSLLKHGRVYPFVAFELSRSGVPLFMKKDVALRYSRISSPWELQSSVWALAFLSQQAGTVND